MATAPAFQEYAKDNLSDGRVPGAPLAALGLLYLLKQRTWLDRTIPNDPTAVARLLGRSAAEVRRLWLHVVPFFEPIDDRLTLPALDEQRQRHAEWREKSIRGGKKSGETRKVKGGSTTVEPSTADAVEPPLNTAICDLQSPISDLHASRKSAPPATRATDELFEQFWKAYPNHKAQPAALKAWRNLNPTPELTSTIVAALQQQTTWPQWTKDKGLFIPHPATWLNQHGWEDQPATVKTPIAKTGEEARQQTKHANAGHVADGRMAGILERDNPEQFGRAS